jgi:ADP-ribose pyrophosphatase
MTTDDSGAVMKPVKTVEPGKISSRRIHTGKVINLDVDTVRFPDGSVGEMDMIRHSGASAIVPFLGDPAGDDPQILMLKQYRYAAEQYLYEIPAGRLDEGESPDACAVRELREETGCTARQMDFLFTMFTTPGFTDEKIHVFLASGLERGAHAREADEFITLETMSLSRGLELIRTGEIKDAKTALGLLFAAGFRAGR